MMAARAGVSSSLIRGHPRRRAAGMSCGRGTGPAAAGRGAADRRCRAGFGRALLFSESDPVETLVGAWLAKILASAAWTRPPDMAAVEPVTPRSRHGHGGGG